MEVTLKINTEKEDINELKKLQTWVSDLIAKREGAMTARIEQQKKEQELKAQQAVQPVNQLVQSVRTSFQTQAVQLPKKEYSGSGKIIDYEDMSDMMSNIYSGGRV